ncbi:hypothetical protein BDZ91DRAFT_718936 [Kalaharituber pfeilii]|nr:hypothetical protein BDZ91DRAFT_718936 [Kalaharituber pfeilii]
MASSDPEAMLHHPLPVRNLIPQIPQTLLSTLLTHYARAYTPKDITVTSLTPQSISLSYLQPVEDIVFKPVPRSATIPFNPPLPPIPIEAHTNTDAAYKWESECANRLKEMEAEARKILEGRSDIVVERYLPPHTIASFLTMFQFIGLTMFIYYWLRYGEDMPYIGGFVARKIFNKEWKFNLTVFFHAAILVKRWGDVLGMAKKLRKHQVDINKRGRVRGPWVKWLINAFFEGWRCEARFDEEVARVGRLTAEKGEEPKKRK